MQASWRLSSKYITQSARAFLLAGQNHKFMVNEFITEFKVGRAGYYGQRCQVPAA
jgi:hypothetical protein